MIMEWYRFDEGLADLCWTRPCTNQALWMATEVWCDEVKDKDYTSSRLHGYYCDACAKRMKDEESRKVDG